MAVNDSSKSNIDENVLFELSQFSSREKTEKTEEKYSEDFNSSSTASISEISRESCCSSVFGDDGDNSDEVLKTFVREKLRILKDYRRKSTKTSGETKEDCNLDAFWLQKLHNLKERNRQNFYKTYESSDKLPLRRTYVTSINHSERKKVENTENVDYFRSAYDRLKFENLRHKYQSFLKSNVHTVKSCVRCQYVREIIEKRKFYADCVNKIKKKTIEERFAQHVTEKTSTMLIAQIIRDGPQPEWTVDKIWTKLLEGGFMM